jgi:hypothetical protein
VVTQQQEEEKKEATPSSPASPTNAAAAAAPAAAAAAAAAASPDRSTSPSVAGSSSPAPAAIPSSPSPAPAAAGSSGGMVVVQSGGEVETWQAVCNVVLTVVQVLETPEVLSAAQQAFSAASRNMSVGSDHQSILEEIFTSHIGLYSRTFKVFQAIHQSILFPAIAYLHSKLYSSRDGLVGTLKDVRRSDGWTVEIYVGAAVYVTHQRWEQSLHPTDSPLHFEVRWEMRLSFDLQLQQLRAVILRIQELRFHEQATADYKRLITEVLTGSGYIV